MRGTPPWKTWGIPLCITERGFFFSWEWSWSLFSRPLCFFSKVAKQQCQQSFDRFQVSSGALQGNELRPTRLTTCEEQHIIYIYIYMVRPPPPVPRFCLISVILFRQFCICLAKLGHQERRVCHNSTIKNSEPKIAGRRSM